MKKLIIAAVIMIALAACGNNSTDSNMNQSPPDTATNTTPDTSSTPDTLNGTVTNPAPPQQ
ncbi:MAG: membrane lipoprotein lipid attachment site-containing protein [Chitinophagaceae bacterium]|nr:membrane lipoprotein lipid attachment site-containing protein [Chitinophagaceae bacterium]